MPEAFQFGTMMVGRALHLQKPLLGKCPFQATPTPAPISCSSSCPGPLGGISAGLLALLPPCPQEEEKRKDPPAKEASCNSKGVQSNRLAADVSVRVPSRFVNKPKEYLSGLVYFPPRDAPRDRPGLA